MRLRREFIASRLPREVPVERCVYDGNVPACLDKLAACDWFVATKFHAAVVGYLSGADLAVIPYHRKLSDFADEIGLPGTRRMPIDSIPSSADWLELLRSFAHADARHQMSNPESAAAGTEKSLHDVFSALPVELFHPE